MHESLAKQVQTFNDNADARMAERMSKYTNFGNLTNWRRNFKNNKRRSTIVRGQQKILNFVLTKA